MKKAFAFAAAAALASLSTVATLQRRQESRRRSREHQQSDAQLPLRLADHVEDVGRGPARGRTLSRGQSIEANIDNGTNECQYDLRAVMADGREVIRRNINVCAVSKWTIGDSGDSIG
jgi:C4-dicarboxylate-specific signal transduction histidine kinase